MQELIRNSNMESKNFTSSVHKQTLQDKQLHHTEGATSFTLLVLQLGSQQGAVAEICYVKYIYWYYCAGTALLAELPFFLSICSQRDMKLDTNAGP